MLGPLVMGADGGFRGDAGASTSERVYVGGDIERSPDSSVDDTNLGKSVGIRVSFQRPPGGERREKNGSFVGGRHGIGRDSVDIHGLH